MRAPELVVVATLVASCWHDATTENPSNRATSASNDDVLAYLPVSSQLVIGVDVARMRTSPLWSRFEPQLAIAAHSELDKIRTSCGFDPMQTVQRVAVGFTWIDDSVIGVAVVRGVDTSRVLECIAAELGEGSDHGTNDRGVVVMDPTSKKASAWTVVGTDTLVMQLGPGANHDSITAVLASGAPLRRSAIFMAMYDRLERTASAWSIVNGASRVLDVFDDVRPRTIDGTVTTTDRVTIAARLKMATPSAAAKLAATITKDLTEAPSLTRHDAVAAGSIVRLDIVLTADQLAAALSSAGFRN